MSILKKKRSDKKSFFAQRKGPGFLEFSESTSDFETPTMRVKVKPFNGDIIKFYFEYVIAPVEK